MIKLFNKIKDWLFPEPVDCKYCGKEPDVFYDYYGGDDFFIMCCDDSVIYNGKTRWSVINQWNRKNK